MTLRATHQLNSFNSASASCSHSPISISRIIAVAVVSCTFLIHFAGSPVQFAETQVAVRDERTHAEFFSDGKSLAIVLRPSTSGGFLCVAISPRTLQTQAPRIRQRTDRPQFFRLRR